jgi:uncharacterized protein YjbI with pentapeptide repeats
MSQEGLRNSHRTNLRGKSFRGKDLTEWNFSGADIRGADFSGATLVQANFENVQAGLQLHWLSLLTIIALILSASSGAMSSVAGAWAVELLTSGSVSKILAGVIVLIIILSFFWITTLRGFGVTLGVLAAILAVSMTLALVLSITSVVTKTGDLVGAVAGAGVLAVSMTGVGAISATITAVLFNRLAVIVVGSFSIIVALGMIATGVLTVTNRWVVVSSGAIAIISALFTSYIGWNALINDEKFPITRGITIFLTTIKGTSFREANLTDATFSYASVRNTNFLNANLTRVCWFQTQKINYARCGDSYLKYGLVRNLLITKVGRDENFDHLDLRRLDLSSAELMGASFIGANLSEANLSGADLSSAKLVQTQLNRTNLSSAFLTGAYIEDWGITSETQLEKVQCQYVYMRLPTKDNPEPHRKPDNRKEIFLEGDFVDFITPIIKTLDLYHNQGVDPRAIAISFKRLAENHPEASLEIVALEKRGQDKFLLRAKTAEEIDRSSLSAEYFGDYNKFKALLEGGTQLLLTEKDDRIHSLETMITTALKRPSFYAEVYQNQGDTHMSEISGINIQGSSNVSGVIGGGFSGVANLGTISGSVTSTISQLPDSYEADKPGIKELLVQLQAAIESEVELSDEDKAEALEQVKVLAEVGKNSQENAMQKVSKTALKILKGTVAGLPSAAKLVEACKNLLPLISKLLGLG